MKHEQLIIKGISVTRSTTGQKLVQLSLKAKDGTKFYTVIDFSAYRRQFEGCLLTTVVSSSDDTRTWHYSIDTRGSNSNGENVILTDWQHLDKAVDAAANALGKHVRNYDERNTWLTAMHQWCMDNSIHA